MGYNTKCPGCNAVRDVAKLESRDDGTVRCRQCGVNFMFAQWTTATNTAPIPANPLPAGTYVVWGMKTKERRGPGVLRGLMEGMSEMRPGAVAQKGGQDYTKLAAGGNSVRIYIAKDEVLLRGQYYAGAPNLMGSGLCVILLNGSGASIGRYMDDVIDGYQRWGAAVLAVDYRGVGKSTGQGTAHGLYTDAEAMLDYVTGDPTRNGRGWPIKRVIVHGFSLGSGPATELAVRHTVVGDRIGGLVLHCPFASFGSAARFKSPGNLWIVGKIASWGVGYDNIHKILHTNMPVHVVYAAQDTYVNPADGAGIAAVNRGAAATTKQEYTGDHLQCDRMFNNAYNVLANTTGTLDNFVTTLPRN